MGAGTRKTVGGHDRGVRMNTMAAWLLQRPRLAWGAVIVLALLAGWYCSELLRQQGQSERLTLLQTEAERQSVALMAQTLNGSLMGALGLLGSMDAELKREARAATDSRDIAQQAQEHSLFISRDNLSRLENVGQAYAAEGVFVVNKDGWVGAAWDRAGKPATGMNVKFRPYYQMAMQGLDSVYAAVSLARGERMLYFSAPIYAENSRSGAATGAIVARTDLSRVDQQLRNKADIALLLTPQDIVFASSKPEWFASMAGQVSPQRLAAIREVRQFGDRFTQSTPAPLPIAITHGIHVMNGTPFAVVQAKVHWNDPLGDWTLVLLEDLSRTVPLTQHLTTGAVSGLLVLLFGALILRSYHVQLRTSRQLNQYASEQQAQAQRKSDIAAAALRLQQADTPERLIQVFLSELHNLLGLMQGVVYEAPERADQPLHLAGSYACSSPPSPSLPPGDGLLGQCAIERRALRIDMPESDQRWQIDSGLGSTRPRTLFFLPLMLGEQLIGVMEAAFLTALNPEAEDALHEMGKLLALNIAIIRRNADAHAQLEAAAAAERASAEQAHFQKVLVDTIPYPVFYKGPDARFLGFNRAYEEAFAVCREDLLGKRVLDLDYLPEADRRVYQAEDEQTIATGGQIQREMRIPFADGKLHDTLYFVSGFRTREGAPGGLVGTFIDISAQKDALRELDRLRQLDQVKLAAESATPLRCASQDNQAPHAHESLADGARQRPAADAAAKEPQP